MSVPPLDDRARFAVVLLALIVLWPLSPAAAQDNKSRNWDPFRAPTRTAKKGAAPRAVQPGELAPPPFSERSRRCGDAASLDGNAAVARPCPYLVQELRVVGVMATSDGVGAFVEAAPSKQTLVIHKGDKLFDGEVVSVRPAGHEGPAAVVFKQVTQHRQRGGAIRNVERLVTVSVTPAP